MIKNVGMLGMLGMLDLHNKVLGMVLVIYYTVGQVTALPFR